ncbi:MAG: hypothetical protein Q9182_001114 [Xanthomendoza sp. 2 TL-2023]
MGSAATHGGLGPHIILENTAAELYKAENSVQETIVVPLCPLSRVPLCSAVGINQRYLFYDASYTEKGLELDPSDASEHERLRRLLSMRRLTDFMLVVLFAAGKMPVVVVDPELSSTKTSSKSFAQAQIEKTLSAISPDQRPTLLWVDDLKSLKLEPHQILASGMPIDDLFHHPSILHPDTHYALLTKQHLATSGLKTPKCEVGHIQYFPPPLFSPDELGMERDHSSEHSSADFEPYDQSTSRLQQMPETCTGPRRAWLDRNTSQALLAMRQKSLPYVLKLQQATSGAGTIFVRTPSELTNTCAFVQDVYLPNYLPRLDASNIFLSPLSILLSDIIEGETYAASFFVKRDGSFTTVGISTQIWVSTQWMGSRMIYSSQSSLSALSQPTVSSVASYLHRKGYHGPVGIDVVLSPIGEHYIVDLNVRTPTSMLLGCLRGHFESKGCDRACLIKVTFAFGREEFCRRMEREIREGRLVIVAWWDMMDGSEEDESGRGIGKVVFGAPDEGALEALGKRVQEMGL